MKVETGWVDKPNNKFLDCEQAVAMYKSSKYNVFVRPSIILFKDKYVLALRVEVLTVNAHTQQVKPINKISDLPPECTDALRYCFTEDFKNPYVYLSNQGADKLWRWSAESPINLIPLFREKM